MVKFTFYDKKTMILSYSFLATLVDFFLLIREGNGRVLNECLKFGTYIMRAEL